MVKAHSADGMAYWCGYWTLTRTPTEKHASTVVDSQIKRERKIMWIQNTCFDSVQLIVFPPIIHRYSRSALTLQGLAEMKKRKKKKKEEAAMQIYCVKMAPELSVIMCESNNPARYVRQESMNTEKDPALNSCVLEICRHARCGRVSIPGTLSFWPNLSNLVHSRALYSHRGALCVPPILSFPLTSDFFLFLAFSLKSYRRD